MFVAGFFRSKSADYVALRRCLLLWRKLWRFGRFRVCEFARFQGLRRLVRVGAYLSRLRKCYLLEAISLEALEWFLEVTGDQMLRLLT